MTDGLGAHAAAADTGGLWAAGERLRAIRLAQGQFLGRWAADRLLDAVIDVVADAVAGAWADPSDNEAVPVRFKPRWTGRPGLDD